MSDEQNSTSLRTTILDECGVWQRWAKRLLDDMARLPESPLNGRRDAEIGTLDHCTDRVRKLVAQAPELAHFVYQTSAGKLWHWPSARAKPTTLCGQWPLLTSVRCAESVGVADRCGHSACAARWSIQ